MDSKTIKRIVIGCFILVPLLSSIISTIHLVDLFTLGNPSWISVTISVAIEIGAIASFMTLSILSRLNKGIVWSMFFLLFFMQIVGNVYFSYDWVSRKVIEDPSWLKSFREVLEFFMYNVEEKTSKMILAMLVGIPIPMISVFLLKSTVDYIGKDNVDELASVEVEEKKLEDTGIHIQNHVDTPDEQPQEDRHRLHPSQY